MGRMTSPRLSCRRSRARVGAAPALTTRRG
jgi:hypothetical protein